MDWAFRDVDRDTLTEDIMLKIRKRPIHTEDGHFLLSGVKLKHLEKMPAGTVVFDPQVVLPQSGQGYDTSIYYKNNYPQYANYNYGVADILHLLRSDFGSYHRKRALLQFDLASSIPAGATVTDATLELYCNFIYQGTGSDAGGGTVFPTDFDVHQMWLPWDDTKETPGPQRGFY